MASGQMPMTPQAQMAMMANFQQMGAKGGMPGMMAMPFPGMFPGMQMGPFMGKGQGMNPYTGFDAKGKGKFNQFGKGKGKFNQFGKGKGKGFKGGKGKDGDKEGAEGGEREVSPIVLAQREARARFEKSILDKMQGRWQDEADPETTYTVEDNTCAVSSGEGSRGFRNRLSVYGVELCWDARRFWHYLDLKEFNSAGDEPEKITWNPGKDSPPTQTIVWLKLPPLPEGEEKKEEEAEKPAEEGGAPEAAAEAAA